MLPVARWVVASILLLAHIASASAEEKLWLAVGGKPVATIVGGGEDEFATQRLQRWFAETANVEIGIVPAEGGRMPDEGCVILLGSLDAFKCDCQVWIGSVLGDFDAGDPDGSSPCGGHSQVVRAWVEKAVEVSGGWVGRSGGPGLGGVKPDDLDFGAQGSTTVGADYCAVDAALSSVNKAQYRPPVGRPDGLQLVGRQKFG